MFKPEAWGIVHHEGDLRARKCSNLASGQHSQRTISYFHLMSEKYKIYPEGEFFITLTIVGWIDLFTRRDYADLILKNLNYCIESKGLRVFAFCIMPSHLHLIASTDDGIHLSDVLRDFKSYTAKELIKAVETHPQESRKEWLLHMFKYFAKGNSHAQQYQVWQQHNHPIDLHSHELFQQRLDYIHNNPVMAGIVGEPHHYLYSSANLLNGLKLSVY